ncbi:MAG: phycobilisome protein [Cyanobacteria bacterium J06623_7]
MIAEIDDLIYQAEAAYLVPTDLGIFKTRVLYLEQRLKIYEQLRELETEVFQYAANYLSDVFVDESPANIKLALKHWLIIMRYCGMAMLSNDSQYLEQRILNWLPEQIAAYEIQELERNLYSCLRKRFKKLLGGESFSILEPYLEQCQRVLQTS